MFDVETLRRTIAQHGPVARVVIASVEGSSPREIGASMLVWPDGQSGTIGGGALEWQAMAVARETLASGGTRIDRIPLGPALGQCCGGAVTLLTEVYGQSELAQPPTPNPSPQGGGEAMADLSHILSRHRTTPDPVPGPDRRGQRSHMRLPSPLWGGDGGGGPPPADRSGILAHLRPDVIARSVDGSAMPLAAKRLLDRARAQGQVPAPTLLQGWFIEPVARPLRHLWIWGAGHVGRALVGVIAPLPDLAVTWIDVAPDRFPTVIPGNVTALPAADPAALVRHAPQDADHLILTYSHALDLDLCHRLLTHGFASAGLIGSATKWARFRSRLSALGHVPQDIARIRCPIGDPAFGKHPQAIAIGVASAFLAPRTAARQEIAG